MAVAAPAAARAAGLRRVGGASPPSLRQPHLVRVLPDAAGTAAGRVPVLPRGLRAASVRPPTAAHTRLQRSCEESAWELSSVCEKPACVSCRCVSVSSLVSGANNYNCQVKRIKEHIH
eukprot:scaffold73552_cov63-Phaeocystis_antarctica.AAC.4